MAGPGHETLVVTTLDGSGSRDTEDSAGHTGWSGAARAPAGHRVGCGRAGRHHGEVLQGLWQPPAVEGVSAVGGPVPCLVTMPVPETGSCARFVPRADPSIEVRPAWKVKAARAARLTLDFLGERRTGGVLTVDCPVPAGLGLGSSTSDVVAAIRAVCHAQGAPIEPARLARLAVEAEGASDPLMFDAGVLFAPRQGRVLEHWEGAFPDYLVVSVDTDPRAAGIDTLSLANPSHSPAALARYEELIRRARAAFRERDAAAMAAVATRSAELNQSVVPMRGFADLLALAQRPGCLGLQISHSGTVAGLLFDPAAGREAAGVMRPALAALGMRCLGTFRTRGTLGDGHVEPLRLA